MQRTILLLSLALVLQIALVLGLRLAGGDPGAFEAGGTLLALSQEQIDQVQIDGSEQERVELRKVDGRWTLPGHHDAPADAQKVDSLISALLGVERSWPVATTDEAMRRFKVADTDFERRLLFKSGDKDLATLLLGSSPGFRKVHARLAGEQQVFDIPFSTYQASIKAPDWLDKTLLQLKTEQISAIDLPDCRLIRQDGQPTLADLAETEQADHEKTRQLFDRLARLSVLDVFAKAEKPLPKPVELRIGLELADGAVRTYDFSKGEEDGHAVLKVSDALHLYKVSDTLLKDLQETSRMQLVQSQEKTAQTSPE